MNDKEFKITYIAPPISEITKTAYIKSTTAMAAKNKLLSRVKSVEEVLSIEEV